MYLPDFYSHNILRESSRRQDPSRSRDSIILALLFSSFAPHRQNLPTCIHTYLRVLLSL